MFFKLQKLKAFIFDVPCKIHKYFIIKIQKKLKFNEGLSILIQNSYTV